MTHHELALKRTNRFERNADNDEDRGAADADAAKLRNAKRQNDREYCDDSEEYRADQRRW